MDLKNKRYNIISSIEENKNFDIEYKKIRRSFDGECLCGENYINSVICDCSTIYTSDFLDQKDYLMECCKCEKKYIITKKWRSEKMDLESMDLEPNELNGKVYLVNGKDKKDITEQFYNCLFKLVKMNSYNIFRYGNKKSIIINCDGDGIVENAFDIADTAFRDDDEGIKVIDK